MQAEWEPDELIDTWTLTGGDWDLMANKAGVTRLGFAVMLKFHEIEGRFPAYAKYSCRAGRSSTTGRRSAGGTGRGRRPTRMRTGARSGWPMRCARRRRTGTV